MRYVVNTRYYINHREIVDALTHAAEAIQSRTDSAANSRLRGVILLLFLRKRFTKSMIISADPINDKAAVIFGVITLAFNSFVEGSMIMIY